jgi:hypothetical protein
MEGAFSFNKEQYELFREGPERRNRYSERKVL